MALGLHRLLMLKKIFLIWLLTATFMYVCMHVSVCLSVLLAVSVCVFIYLSITCNIILLSPVVSLGDLYSSDAMVPWVFLSLVSR